MPISKGAAPCCSTEPWAPASPPSPGRGSACCELACLTAPDEIAALHRAYLDAGCRAIKVNTFTVSVDLAQGRDELAADLIRAACSIAVDCAVPRGAYVFADLGPAPEGAALSRGEVYRRQAELFLAQGVTCFLLACNLRRELGVEPLPHLTCRDRNLNATKALLLGLSMEGVHNVLLVTGDPIPTTDRDEVNSVFNFNSRKLARETLNGKILGGIYPVVATKTPASSTTRLPVSALPRRSLSYTRASPGRRRRIWRCGSSSALPGRSPLIPTGCTS